MRMPRRTRRPKIPLPVRRAKGVLGAKLAELLAVNAELGRVSRTMDGERYNFFILQKMRLEGEIEKLYKK